MKPTRKLKITIVLSISHPPQRIFTLGVETFQRLLESTRATGKETTSREKVRIAVFKP